MNQVQSQLLPHLTEDDLATLINDKVLAPFQLGSIKHRDAIYEYATQEKKRTYSGVTFDPSLGKCGAWFMFHEVFGWQHVSEQQVWEHVKSHLSDFVQNDYMQAILHIRNVLKRRELYQSSPRLRDTIREHARLAIKHLRSVEEDSKSIMKDTKELATKSEFIKHFDEQVGKLAFNDAERSGAISVFDAISLTVITDLPQIKAMHHLKRLGLMFSPLQCHYKCPNWLQDIGRQLSKVIFNCGTEENGVYVLQVYGSGSQQFVEGLKSAMGTYCVDIDESIITTAATHQVIPPLKGLRCCITHDQVTLTKKVTEMQRTSQPIVLVYNSGSDRTQPQTTCQKFASVEVPAMNCSPEEVVGWLVDCMRSSHSSATSFQVLDHSIQHKALLRQFLAHRKWSATETSEASRKMMMTGKAILNELCTWGSSINYNSVVITQVLLAEYLKEEGFHVTRPQNVVKVTLFCKSEKN